MSTSTARASTDCILEKLETRTLFALIAGELHRPPICMAMGDLNGDGLPDLAIIHRDLASRNILLSVRLADRKGGYIRGATVDLTPEEFAAMTIGDVNGDGLPDIVIAGISQGTPGGTGPTPNVTVYLGDGKGGFQQSSKGTTQTTTIALPAGTIPTGITTGDLDGDGSVDIAVVGQVDPHSGTTTGRRTAIDILWGSPAGTPPPTSFASFVQDKGVQADAIYAGDLNGDGIPDLVAVQSQGTILDRLWPHPNVITMTGLTDRKGLSNAQSNPLYQDSGKSGTNPFFESTRTIGLGDLDGDGVPDLVAIQSSRKNGAIIAANYDYKSQRWMAPESIKSTGIVPVSADFIAIGDLNGDGHPDILAYQYSPKSDVWSFGINTIQPDGTTALVWSSRSDIVLY